MEFSKYELLLKKFMKLNRRIKKGSKLLEVVIYQTKNKKKKHPPS